jgi:hypothetical protein
MKNILPFLLATSLLSCTLLSSTTAMLTNQTAAATTESAQIASPRSTWLAIGKSITVIPSLSKNPTENITATPEKSIDGTSAGKHNLRDLLVGNADIPDTAIDFSRIFQKTPKPTPLDSGPVFPKRFCTSDCVMRTWKAGADWFRLALYRLESEETAKAAQSSLWDEVLLSHPSAKVYDPTLTDGLFADILPGQYGWAANGITNKNGACGTFSQYLGTSFGPVLLYIEYSREAYLDIPDDNGTSLLRMAQLQVRKIRTAMAQ